MCRLVGLAVGPAMAQHRKKSMALSLLHRIYLLSQLPACKRTNVCFSVSHAQVQHAGFDARLGCADLLLCEAES